MSIEFHNNLKGLTMKRVILLFLTLTSFLYSSEYKMLIDLRTSDSKIIKKALINNINAISEYQKSNGNTINVAVVISGGAYDFFKKEKVSPTVKKELDELNDKGVKFEVCSMGMKARGIKQDELFSYVKPAFNRAMALVKWQNKGYAYILVK